MRTAESDEKVVNIGLEFALPLWLGFNLSNAMTQQFSQALLPHHVVAVHGYRR